jgi:hypothetical protein
MLVKVKEGIDMFLFAVVDPLPVPVYEVAQITQANTKERFRVYGECNLVSIRHAGFDPDNYFRFSPYMAEFLSKDVRERELSQPSVMSDAEWEWSQKWSDGFTTQVLKQPTHGKLVIDNKGMVSGYLPDVGYVGKDRIELLVRGVDDLQRPIAMKLISYVNVVSETALDKAIASKQSYVRTLQKYCGISNPNGFWRISGIQLPDANDATNTWYSTW